MLKIVTDDADRDDLTATVLDELVIEGARRMLATALEAEVADYVARHVGEVDERGHEISPNLVDRAGWSGDVP